MHFRELVATWILERWGYRARGCIITAFVSISAKKIIVLSQPLNFGELKSTGPLCFAPSIRSIRYDLRSFDSLRSSIASIRFDSIRSRRKTKWTVDFSWPKTEGLR